MVKVEVRGFGRGVERDTKKVGVKGYDEKRIMGKGRRYGKI